MNHKQIQYFVEVYHTQNMQTAADKLFVARQGVSRVIHSLEEELGQPLFERTPNGLLPTDYATAVLPYAQHLLSDYDAIAGMNTLAAQSRSVVTIYALDHMFAYFGTDLITDFHDKYPDIILSIVDSTDNAIFAALDGQDCNFGIVIEPFDTTRFQSEPLFFTKYSVRMHKDNPLTQKEILTVDDLSGHAIISKGRAYSCFRHTIDRYILLPGGKINIFTETADETLITQLVAQNKAINLGYDYATALNQHPDIVSRPLQLGETTGRMVYLLANKQLRQTRASRLFHAFFVNWIAEKHLPQKQ